MDASDAAAVEEFIAGFRSTSAALRTELAFTSEAATIRRVLDHGCPLERGILLTVLGHCENVVVKLRAPDDGESQAAQAADERARRFLRGLIGDGEPLAKETLRPVLEAPLMMTCWCSMPRLESSNPSPRRRQKPSSHEIGSLRDVQDLLGHARLNTTQRYLEPSSDAKRRLVDLVWSIRTAAGAGCWARAVERRRHLLKLRPAV